MEAPELAKMSVNWDSSELEILCHIAAMTRRDLVLTQAVTNGWSPLLLRLHKDLVEVLVKISRLKSDAHYWEYGSYFKFSGE